jgi:hypothetical protein
MKKVSVIIPYIRPENIKRLRDDVLKKSGLPEEDVEVIVWRDDKRIGCPKMVKLMVDNTSYDWVCFLGDDTEPTEDFIINALNTAERVFRDGWGLIGFNDLTGRTLPTHWMAHKKLLEHTGGEFFHTGYRHCFCDNELMDIAKSIGRFHYDQSAIVLHNHPLLDNAVKDDGSWDYGYKKENYIHDETLYGRRKRERLANVESDHRKIALAFPHVDEQVSWRFLTSYIELDKSMIDVILTPTFKHTEGYRDIADIRNNLVRQAQDAGCTHILFMDTDQTYPPDTISKLVSHDADIVGGVIHRRWEPYEPVLKRGEPGAYTKVPDKEAYSGDVIDVDATGTGCILIKMIVFDCMRTPFQIIQHNGRTVGEDIYFCQMAKKLGFDIKIDTSIQIDHLGVLVINRDWSALYRKLMGASECI